MSTRGSSIINSIQAMVDEEDAQKSAIARQLQRNEAGQEEQRKIKFQALAAMSDAILESGMADGRSLSLISADVEHMVAQREAHYRDIESTVDDDRLELKKAQESYDQAKINLAQVNERVFAEVSQDASIQQLRKEVEQARDIAENAESLTASIGQEVAGKLRAYESDAVFQHLLRRGYATPAYKGAALYAWLDGWLADKSQFRQAHADYTMMLALPDEAKKREGVVEATYEQLKHSLDLAIERARSNHNVAGAKRKMHAASEKLRLCQEHINRDQDAINAFLKKTDEMFTRVRKRTNEVLSQFSVATLERLINATPSSADDKALERYQMAVRREKQLQEEESSLRVKLSKAEESFKRAKLARTMFRDQDYDAHNRRYESGFDINSLMVGYMAGQLSLNDLSRRCDNSSEIIRESSSYSSSSSSSSGGFGSSDSFGSDSSRRSGSNDFTSSGSFGSDSGGFTSSDSF